MPWKWGLAYSWDNDWSSPFCQGIHFIETNPFVMGWAKQNCDITFTCLTQRFKLFSSWPSLFICFLMGPYANSVYKSQCPSVYLSYLGNGTSRWTRDLWSKGVSLILGFRKPHFYWLDPLGRVSHRVAMSVCQYVCQYVPPGAVFLERSSSHPPKFGVGCHKNCIFFIL